MFAILGKQRDGIESGTIMMQLPLEPPVFGGEDEIPISTGAAVITPVRDWRIVAEDRIEGHLCFILVPEVFRPGINLFLTGGIPGHLAAEGIGFLSPAIGSDTHFSFKVVGLLLPAFTLKIAQNLEKDISLHLAEDSQVCRVMGHGDGSLISLTQIPIPGVVRHHPFMVA